MSTCAICTHHIHTQYFKVTTGHGLFLQTSHAVKYLSSVKVPYCSRSSTNVTKEQEEERHDFKWNLFFGKDQCTSSQCLCTFYVYQLINHECQMNYDQKSISQVLDPFSDCQHTFFCTRGDNFKNILVKLESFFQVIQSPSPLPA